MTLSRRAAALSAIAALVATACRSGQDAPPPPSVLGSTSASEGAPVAPAASALPVDHLGPGELIEGTERAFGVVLPRDVRIEESFVDVVVARGPVSVHALAGYLRARLQEGGLREGSSSATFEHVKVPGKPGLELSMRIVSWEGGARLEVRDTTPQPAADLPDEAARWRQAGLTPEGRVLDPTHLD
jgi:hypothetical protein